MLKPFPTTIKYDNWKMRISNRTSIDFIHFTTSVSYAFKPSNKKSKNKSTNKMYDVHDVTIQSLLHNLVLYVDNNSGILLAMWNHLDEITQRNTYCILADAVSKMHHHGGENKKPTKLASVHAGMNVSRPWVLRSC